MLGFWLFSHAHLLQVKLSIRKVPVTPSRLSCDQNRTQSTWCPPASSDCNLHNGKDHVCLIHHCILLVPSTGPGRYSIFVEWMNKWMTKADKRLHKAREENLRWRLKRPTFILKKKQRRGEIARKRMRDSKIRKFSTNKQDKNSLLPLSF